MFYKFQRPLSEIGYIISFDLALYKTGVSIYDIKNKTICRTDKIEVLKSDEKPVATLYELLKDYLTKSVEKYGDLLMVIKEAMPAQAGRFTTIATLQTLAKAHAALDIAVAKVNGVDFYDDIGVHAVSVKALFKTEECPKPTKTDIKEAVCDKFKLDKSKLSDDESDSIAVIYTLLQKKWNADIKDEIKRIKKEMKSLKQERAIAAHEKRIEELERMILEVKV